MQTKFSAQAKQQKGFTLIELIVVIVILGILAATALPKFVDLSAEAEQAGTDGVAGGLSSAGAINYAACKAGNAACQVTTGLTCAAAAALILDSVPAGYTIGGNVPSCTITRGVGSSTAVVPAT